MKMYAKTKELGPIGGGVCPARPSPRSANVYSVGLISQTYRLIYEEITGIFQTIHILMKGEIIFISHNNKFQKGHKHD